MPINEQAADAALGMQAQQNDAATVAVPSAQAAQAISQEYSMGIPASGGMYSPQPEEPEEPADVHPAVQAYAASDPSRAAVIRDDWGPLSGVAHAIGKVQLLHDFLLPGASAARDLLNFKKNMAASDEWNAAHPVLSMIPGANPVGRQEAMDAFTLLPPVAVYSGLSNVVAQNYARLMSGLSPMPGKTVEETYAQNVADANLAMMAVPHPGFRARGLTGGVEVPLKAKIASEAREPEGQTPQQQITDERNADFEPSVPRLEGPRPSEELHLFDEPPAPGTDPHMDELYEEHAISGEEFLDEAVKATQDTGTYSRSPIAVQELASQVAPEATVSVSIDKLQELHSTDIAFKDVWADHLIDVVGYPDGNNVTMPLSAYLAHMSPWHEQLKGDIAIGDGISVNEAKELKEQRASLEAPPVNTNEAQAETLDQGKAIGALYSLPEKQWQQFYATTQSAWGVLPSEDFEDSIMALLDMHPKDVTPEEQPILDLLNAHGIKEKAAAQPKVAPAQTSVSAPAQTSHPDYDEDIAASMGVGFGDFMHATGKEFPEPEDFDTVDIADKDEIADAKAAVAAAVEKVAKDHWLRQLFNGASTLGMSPEQFRQYSLKGQAAFEAAKQKLWERTLNRVKDKYTTEWQNAYKQQYNHALNLWMAKPIIKAEHALRYSAKDQTTNIQTAWKNPDGTPITFYHAGSHSNVGTPDNPWKLMGYSVISFAETPSFANDWLGGDSFDPYHVQTGYKQEYAKTIYVTHLKVQHPADFRNPADVAKASAWYQEHTGSGSKYSLERGSYSLWERPEMWNDVGFDGARMVEGDSHFSKIERGISKPNACVSDPEQIIFKYAVRFEEMNYKLALDNQYAYPAYYWDSLPNSFFSKEGGFDADTIADQVGYTSGMEMLDELNSFEKGRGKTPFMTYFLGLVKNEARIRTMAELYGIKPSDPKGLTQADVKAFQANAILEEAQAIFSEPAITDLIIDQLNHLLFEAGQEPITFEQIKAVADEQFSAMPMKRALNQRFFERYLTTSGRKVEALLLKGKVPEALQLKQRQVIAQIQLLASHKLKGEAKSGDKKIARWARNPTMKKQDQRTLNFLRFILKSIGVNIKLGKFESVEQALDGETFQQFIDSLRAEGKEPIVFGLPLTDTFDLKKLENYTVDEYRGLVEMLKSIANLGMDKAMGKMLGEKLSFDEIVKEIAANADGAGRKFTPGELREARERAFKELGLGSTGMGAYIARPETVAYVLDGFKLGPMTRSVIMPSMRAKHAKADMVQDFSTSVREFMKVQPKEWNKSLKQGLHVPELTFGTNKNGQPTAWIRNRSDLIMLMLNVGTQSNLEKLAKGFGWSSEAIFNVIWQHATEADWKYVKFLWDQHEKLWPRIRDLGREVQGLAPKKIEGHDVPVNAAGDVIRGGYWPIRYDPTCVGAMTFDDGKEGTVRDPTLLDTNELFGTEYHSALPNNRHTLARTKFLAPLNLNMETIYLGYMQVMHDLAYRPALIQANKVLTHPTVRRAITDVLGKTYLDELDHWLVYQARQSVYDGKSLKTLTGWVQVMRTGFMNVTMMYNLKTSAKHALIAMSHISTEVSPKYATAALSRLFQTGEQAGYWSKFVTDNSGEVRNVMLNLDRDVREAMEKCIAENGGVMNTWQYNGYILFTLAKQGESLVTWLGKYMQQIDEDVSHEDAVFIADKSVRDTQGAGSISDLPPLWRGGQNFWGELGKMMNMFTSFENATGNRVWVMKKRAQRMLGGSGGKGPPDEPGSLDGWQDDGWAGNRRDLSHIVTSGLGFLLIPAIIAAVYDIVVSKDSWEHFAEKVFANFVKGAFGGSLPLGNSLEAIPHMLAGDKTHIPTHPMFEALENVTDTVRHAHYAVDLLTGRPEKVPPKWVGQAVDTAGYMGMFTPYGGLGVRPIKNLALASMDKARNHTGWGEFVREFAFGQSAEEKKRGQKKGHGMSMRLKL